MDSPERVPAAEPARAAAPARALPVEYALAADSASMARYALARQVAPPAAGALTDAQATEAVMWPRSALP